MPLSRGTQLTEEDVISNSKLDHLYNHEFEKGRFFQVVFEDDNEILVKLAPRTLMKVTYIKDHDDIEGLSITKVVSGEEKQNLKFSKFNLQQLQTFLQFINDIDLKGVSERRIQLADDSLEIIDEETKKKILTLMSGSNGSNLVEEILESGVLTDRDIVNTGYRKVQLELFGKLLYEDYLEIYKESIGRVNTKDETAWQHFFNVNPWIFGYGLDYRFQGIIQKEFSASDTDADGKNQVNADYLIGDNRFTTFVELKLPNTELFSSTQNRSRTWKLSGKLQDAVSQILEQKASGQIKIETKELFDGEGELIEQNSFDSKAVLIIGNWDEINSDDPRTQKTKTKTLELYRRNLRNVDIITYDELFERAKYIVNEIAGD
jgi:hypothetical protein